MNSASRPAARRHVRMMLLLLLIAGLAWRLALFAFPNTNIDSDTALYGLMARHILAGQFPLFTWGQHYMGTLESLVAAGFFLLLGPTYHALQLAPMLFCMLYLGTLWLLGRELFGPAPALWGVAYAAAPPYALMMWSVAPRGGYSETLFFGTAVLWLTLVILRRDGGGRREWAALGLVAGVGFWTNFLIGYYIIPAGLALLVGLGRRCFAGRTLVGIAVFAAGSLPVWIYNVPRGFVSFRMRALGSYDASKGFKILFASQLGDILSLSGHFFQDFPASRGPWLLLGGAVYLFFGAFFFGISLKAVAGFIARRRSEPGAGLLLLFLAGMIILFAQSRFAQSHTSRYLVPIYSVVPLLGPGFVAHTAGRVRRVGTAVWAGLIVVNTLFLGSHLLLVYPGIKRDEASVLELLRTLAAEGETRGVTDYAYNKRLNFLAGERVVFSMPKGEHYLPFQTTVEESPRVVFFFRRPGLTRALRDRGVRFRERDFLGWSLLSAVEPPGEELRPIPRERWSVSGTAAAWTDGMKGGGRAPGDEAEETTIDLGAGFTPALLRVVYDHDRWPGRWLAWSSMDGREWASVLASDPSVEPVFVSGPRAFESGMHMRAEYRLATRPARYLRLRREPVPGERLGGVEEIALYEAAARDRDRDPGPPPAVLAYLREARIVFTYADRWESAVITGALGKARAAVPFNRVHHPVNRNGVVEASARIAFLVRSSEAEAVRETLLAEMIAEERRFGDFTLLVLDALPEAGATGLFWTGFSLLYEGREGRALWLRRAAQRLARAGRFPEAAARLREAIAAAPGFLLARRELDGLERRIAPPGTRTGPANSDGATTAIAATFAGGVRLADLDLEGQSGGTALAYTWEFAGVPDPEIWVATRCEAQGRFAEEGHRLAEAGPAPFMFPENRIRDRRTLSAALPSGATARCSVGLWYPRRHWRVGIIAANHPVRWRRVQLPPLRVP